MMLSFSGWWNWSMVLNLNYYSKTGFHSLRSNKYCHKYFLYPVFLFLKFVMTNPYYLLGILMNEYRHRIYWNIINKSQNIWNLFISCKPPKAQPAHQHTPSLSLSFRTSLVQKFAGRELRNSLCSIFTLVCFFGWIKHLYSKTISWEVGTLHFLFSKGDILLQISVASAKVKSDFPESSFKGSGANTKVSPYGLSIYMFDSLFSWV